MYKDISAQTEAAVTIDPEFEHFVGQYVDVNKLDLKAKRVYGDVLQATGRIIDDACGMGFDDYLKTEELSTMFQHLTSFKLSYEHLMKHMMKLVKVAHEHIKE